MTCEAEAMHRSVMGDDLGPVTPCEALGEVPMGDFVLCVGCAEALDVLLALGDACLRHQGTEDLRRALGEDGGQ